MTEMGDLMFVGLNPRWQMYRFLPRGLNVMFSAGGFWDGTGWRWGRWPKGCGLRFLDCGGFLAMNRWGDYPFNVPAFMCLVAKLAPDRWATMDYPCEPQIARGSRLQTNEERINATVALAAECLTWADHVPGQAVPVIQGYTLDEYRLCLDLHAEAGTIREYMAVGSMCRRMDAGELHELIPGIYEHARALGVERLHFFGLKLDPALDDLRGCIYSRDSAVALDDYGSWVMRLSGRRYPRGQAEKEIVFAGFLRRLDALGLQYIADPAQAWKEAKAEGCSLLEVPAWLWPMLTEADWRALGELDTGLLCALEEEFVLGARRIDCGY